MTYIRLYLTVVKIKYKDDSFQQYACNVIPNNVYDNTWPFNCGSVSHDLHFYIEWRHLVLQEDVENYCQAKKCTHWWSSVISC